MTERISTIVLGGTGYVSGELLRLLAMHPRLAVQAVVSHSSPGAAVEEHFPHLASAYPELRFSSRDSLPALLNEAPEAAIFSAGPHGDSAGEIDEVLNVAENAGVNIHLVDLSADFRYTDADEYEKVYKTVHAAPGRLGEFVCSVPEHAPERLPRHACQPGCFTTSVVLPSAGLVGLGLIEPHIQVTAITGSTGSGKTPKPTTHHPERLSNLFAYGALTHRHQPEMENLVQAATGVETEIDFVPHSGPFARGIHATLHARLKEPMDAEEVAGALSGYYAEAHFVSAQARPPRLKQVVGTNYCRIGVAARGKKLVVFSVIDNLVKGAAGGAVQWMNRLFGFDETAGLTQPGLGWF